MRSRHEIVESLWGPFTIQQAQALGLILADHEARLAAVVSPEVVPPEVTTDALNKLLADTANGWRSGGALHIAFNLARQAEAHERARAADKARIAALESQLADERRQFASRRGELEQRWAKATGEAQAKLHTIDTAAGTWRPNAPADVQPVAWIEKIVEEYQRTGMINMDELIKLLGDPNGSVSFSDPLTAVRDAISATYPTALAK